MRKAIRITAKVLVVTIAAAFVFGIAFLSYNSWLQVTLGPRIEREFGFELGSPYYDDGTLLGAEVIELEYVQAGGVFDEVGFARGEVIIEPRMLGKIYRVLDSSRGKEVTFTTIPGGDGEPMSKRPRRRITFIVPPPN